MEENLWRELFPEFKIQHTTTPPYNPSSNPVERFHRTLTGLGVPYTLCREDNHVPLDWGHDGRETTSPQDYDRSASWKSESEHTDVQDLDTEYPSRMFSVVFQSEDHPWKQS